MFAPARLAACVLALLAEAARAAAASPAVEVASLRCNAARPANGGAPWLEVNVLLNVRPSPGSPAQMVSRVRVGVLLAFELPAPAGSTRRLEAYAGAVECVALEPGRAEVRFYLPPELVKRDQLRGDPKFWGVELIVGGQPVPPGKGAWSAGLASPAARREFQQRTAASAAANEGLLQPQHLTPFALEHPRNTPSVVRREPR